MTDTPSADSPAPEPDTWIGVYTQALLERVTDPASRAALRRGGTPALEHYAYPYLARRWATDAQKVWMRRPMLLHAAAAASYQRIADEPGRGLGDLAAVLTFGEQGLSATGIERRLLAVQRQSLPGAHRLLTGIYAPADSRPGSRLDWADLLRVYLRWDHPTPTVRTAWRRTLLRDYHRARHISKPASDRTDDRSL